MHAMMALMEQCEEARQEFDGLARRLGAELVQYAYERTWSLEGAQDVVQRALLKAWVVFRDGARPFNPRAWLYRIVHNEAANDVRSDAVRRRLGVKVATPVSSNEPDGLLGAQVRETLDAVRGLPDESRDIIVLHYMQGLSISETAEIMGIPAGTAKSQIARGLDLLRARLQGGCGHEG